MFKKKSKPQAEYYFIFLFLFMTNANPYLSQYALNYHLIFTYALSVDNTNSYVDFNYNIIFLMMEIHIPGANSWLIPGNVNSFFVLFEILPNLCGQVAFGKILFQFIIEKLVRIYCVCCYASWFYFIAQVCNLFETFKEKFQKRFEHFTSSLVVFSLI